jgi:tetratricopeptide (TPR) repeat protein
LAISAAIAGCAHLPGASEPQLTALEQAEAFLRNGYPERALPLLNELERRSPDDLTVARLVVEAHLRAGRAEELVARLSSRPERAASHFMLGLLYSAQGRGAGGPSANDEVIAEFDRAIALRPAEAELHYRLGVVLLEREQYRASADSLSLAVRLDARSSAAYLPLAKALLKLDKPKDALAALQSWLARTPPQREVATAMALIEDIVIPGRRLPESAEEKFIHGVDALNQADDPLQAISIFDELLRENPGAAIAHTMLALCYQRLDDAARALDELRQAADLAPEDGRNQLYLGELYLGRGQANRAKAAFRRALELNPLLGDAHLRLGELAFEESDFKSACRYLAAAALLSSRTTVRLKLARALQLDRDYAAADRELRALLKLDPLNPDLMLRLGLLHADAQANSSNPAQRSWSRTEAIRWLREVIRVEGDNVAAARTLESLGSG